MVLTSPEGKMEGAGQAKEPERDLATRLTRLEDIWQRGQRMLSQIQKEQSSRTDRLAEEMAACRAENEELRRALEALQERVSLGEALAGKGKASAVRVSTGGATGAGEGSTASGASSPQQVSQEEVFADSPGVMVPPHGGSPTEPLDIISGAPVFGSQPCRLMDALQLPGEGPAASHWAAAATPVPEMPGFLMSAAAALSPAAAPVPLSLAAAFGATSPTPVPVAVPQEQRPLSLADALAADEEETATLQAKVFTVTLEKDVGAGLGLNVSHTERERVLRVDGVWPDGAVEAWNQRCAQSSLMDSPAPDVPAQNRALGTGDRIISVNSVARDAKRMLQECRENAQLKLTIMRGGPAVPASSAPRPSSLRADASVFVPSSAVTASPSTSGTSDSPLPFGGSPIVKVPSAR